MIVFPLYFTTAPPFVNVISHPALHSVTTEMRECAARPGIMYPLRAAAGSCGMSRRHLFSDLTLFPSGSVTLIWSPSWSIVVACAFVIKKLLVAPESRIAHWRILSLLIVTVSSRALAAALNPFIRHWSWYVVLLACWLWKPGGMTEVRDRTL